MSKLLQWISHQFNLGTQLRFWRGIPYLAVVLTCIFIGWSLWSEVENLQATSYLIFPFLIYGIFEFGSQGLGWIYSCFRSDTGSQQMVHSQKSLFSVDLRILVIGWIVALLLILSLPLIILDLMGV